MIKTGKLIHSVVIQKKITSRDSMGAEIITWEEFARTWASVEPLMGREYFLANQLQAAVDFKITMRYQSGLQPEMRAYWNSRIFDIKNVINTEERNIELILYCKEFVT